MQIAMEVPLRPVHNVFDKENPEGIRIISKFNCKCRHLRNKLNLFRLNSTTYTSMPTTTDTINTFVETVHLTPSDGRGPILDHFLNDTSQITL